MEYKRPVTRGVIHKFKRTLKNESSGRYWTWRHIACLELNQPWIYDTAWAWNKVTCKRCLKKKTI